MNNKEEIRRGLVSEYAELDRRIGELHDLVEGSKGAVRLYRKARLDMALQAQERLSERLKLLRRAEGDQKWSEAERLWSDLHNFVLKLS